LPTWSSSRSAPARPPAPRRAARRAARSLLPPPATTRWVVTTRIRRRRTTRHGNTTRHDTTATTRESQRDGFCRPVGRKEAAAGRAKGGTAISQADLDPRLVPRTRRRRPPRRNEESSRPHIKTTRSPASVGLLD